ncbi:UNVERIFIED_ORG: acyl-CoA reductase-like NAD-dependent aldehyde dehydrogenase [Gordonia westfalica J30]
MGIHAMTIDGRAESSTREHAVINPANGGAVGTAPECSAAQLNRAMESAADAFVTWRTDADARRAALARAARVIETNAVELARLLSQEQGKPLRSEFGDAYGEIATCVAYFDYYAGVRLDPEVMRDDDTARVEVHRRPLGVVAAITPWNFPAYLSMWKVAPALLAGNTMVLKPSEFTPLTVLRIGELLREVLPPGVFNVVTGGGELGARMATHPLVRKISFTGSTVTGKKVAAAAASDLKRVTLELGGNDPAIVLDDADLESVMPQIFSYSFANCGQVCTNIKRVYVPESLYEEAVELLAAQARSVRLGDGLDASTQLGPLNNLPQLERVEELVADAVAGGARIAAGGERRPGGGWFYEPTILADVNDGDRIVDEEQFGPALPVVAYRGIDDAVNRANAGHFGLTASVWTGDPERAASITSQLECGTVWTNTHNEFGLDQPFAGQKWSGIGVENGRFGLLGYTQIQVQHRPRYASEKA